MLFKLKWWFKKKSLIKIKKEIGLLLEDFNPIKQIDIYIVYDKTKIFLNNFNYKFNFPYHILVNYELSSYHKSSRDMLHRLLTNSDSNKNGLITYDLSYWLGNNNDIEDIKNELLIIINDSINLLKFSCSNDRSKEDIIWFNKLNQVYKTFAKSIELKLIIIDYLKLLDLLIEIELTKGGS